MQRSPYSGRWSILERCQQNSESTGAERWVVPEYMEILADIPSSNSYLHGRSCSPTVLHSSVFVLRHQISPNNPSANSARRGGSVKCIAVIVCHIRSTNAYYGMLLDPLTSPGTNNLRRWELSFVSANIPRGSRATFLITRRINTAWILSQCYLPWLYSISSIQAALCLGKKATFRVEKREKLMAFITNPGRSAGILGWQYKRATERGESTYSGWVGHVLTGAPK